MRLNRLGDRGQRASDDPGRVGPHRIHDREVCLGHLIVEITISVNRVRRADARLVVHHQPPAPTEGSQEPVVHRVLVEQIDRERTRRRVHDQRAGALGQHTVRDLLPTSHLREPNITDHRRYPLCTQY